MSEPVRFVTKTLISLAAVGSVVGGCARPAPETEPVAITLAPVDRDQFDARVAAHRGQVVLVDFWATWCAPCIELFPHSVELERRHRGQGLAVMSVSMDDEADRESALAFLRSQDAGHLENLISRYGVGPRSMQVFEVPGGAVPHYKLYDRSGELRQTFTLDAGADRQFTPADIQSAVERLLGE
jgi:thiol-disulfide isomerase/thioredoxin